VFWAKVEGWTMPALFSGRYEPEFAEEWMHTRHVARLHTCLMQFNPGPLRAALRGWACQFPQPWRQTAEFPFIRMHFIPALDSDPLCYDTCAGLWQAGLGTPFTEEQNAAFEHLHCATYVDAITTGLRSNLAAAHAQVYADPERARGFRTQQADYYRTRTLEPVNSH